MIGGIRGIRPVGTAGFSRGRQPTVKGANDPRSRVAATERVVRDLSVAATRLRTVYRTVSAG